MILVVSFTLGTIMSVWVFGDTPKVVQTNKAPRSTMNAKLTSSQRVLDGLVRRNFAAMQQGAADLRAISEADQWPRSPDPVFEHFAREFRRQCRQLESLAKERNPEGATFTYLQITSTCVQCHDYVRDSMNKQIDEKRRGVAPIPSHWPE